MKIAWFTPFVQTSAIGKVGAELCEELKKEHEVEIWTAHRDNLIETDVPVRTFVPGFDLNELSAYDAVIYNLGNFAGFHREIYDVSQRFPGVVILHDQTMAGFWGQYHCIPEFGGDDREGVEHYRQSAVAYYGAAAGQAVQQALESGQYPFYAHASMDGCSFLEPCVKGAKGVFTHAAFFADQLREIANIPTSYAYLPCRAPELAESDSALLHSLLAKARNEHKKLLVSTGIVHPVKQIDKIVQMLLEDSALAEKICYLVIGSCDGEYGERLKKLAENELRGSLYMLGYQPYAVMWEALRAADMAVNLRYPNSEVCSLSLLEQMSVGKAVMTLDTGIYGEVPADTVIRVSRSSILSEGKEILRALADDELEERISRVGARAAEFVAQQCTAANYCKRLLQFIAELDEERALCELQNRVIRHVGTAMCQLRLNEAATPASYAAVIDRLAGVLGEKKMPAENRTLGFWIGFPYYIPGLSREGISRLMGYMGSSLLRYHPDVSIEAWCYSANLEEMETIFASVREEDRSRIHFITEKNWAEALHVPQIIRNTVGEVNVTDDTLVHAVRAASKASVFVPIILYLDRITEAGKRICVPGYDMAAAEHYGAFVEKDKNYIARNLDYIWRTQNFAAYGSDFFCNSDTIRRTEILKYIPGLKDTKTHVIYLPANIPEYSYDGLMSESELREHFSITKAYLFYPTQIRPYKNVSTLVRAFVLLRKELPELKLVLTGHPKDVPEVEGLLNETGAYNDTILLHDVSERELYSLYRYAAAVPVPSMMEGGFPYQTMEGLWAESPVVTADIPVTRERILSLGFDPDDCGFALFPPEDPAALAGALKDVLADREAAVKRQLPFKRALFSYTWKEASDQYYKLFFGEGELE